MGDFGKKFREAREKKSLSLDDVSNVTKISSRMLQAIEEEHFDLLPGGVFNKGFIRAYAKHLGLDPEEAVTDYLACLRQAQVDAREVWEPAPVAPAKPAAQKKAAPPHPAPAPPPAPVQVEELPELHLPRAEDVRPPRKDFSPGSGAGIPWGLVSAAVIVVLLAGFLWIRHSRNSKLQTAMASTTATLQPAAAVASVAAPAMTQPAVSEPAKKTTPPSSANPSDTPAKAGAPGSAPEPDKTSDVTVRTFDKPAAKASTKAAPALNLIIRANETSWISVLADGQLVTQETLIAPAHTSVRAARQIDVRIGNAAGISFVLNGKEIPAEGNEAEVKSFIFDESGMKPVAVP